MSQKKAGLLCILLIDTLFAQLAYSAISDHSSLPSWLRSSFVMSLSMGPTWTASGETQTLPLTPTIIKTYTATQPTDTMMSGDFFLGVQFPVSKYVQGQLGMEVAAIDGATLSGDVWDDANEEFNNYTYQYQVQHRYVAIKGKVLADLDLPVKPWLSAAVGVGYNKAYNFSSLPTIEEALPVPAFAHHTKTSFTYAIGIGFQHVIKNHWEVGLGYEFADAGKSQLGKVEGSSHSGLALSHLYTHSLLVNLTYLA